MTIISVELPGGCEMVWMVFVLGLRGEGDCELYPFTETGSVDCGDCGVRACRHEE
jgi:hypothetical protein